VEDKVEKPGNSDDEICFAIGVLSTEMQFEDIESLKNFKF
jgi:hypothetical protein